MQTRYIPLICIVIMTACAPGQESASSKVDSLLLAEPVGPQPGSTEKNTEWVKFTDDAFFEKVLPFELSDSAALADWFPKGPTWDGTDMDDGKPWYRWYTYEGEGFNLSFFDYFENEPQRYYYWSADITNPAVVIAKGVHAGMSKREFFDVVDLPEDKIDNDDFRVYREGTFYSIAFRFLSGNLYRIEYSFEYDSMPKSVEDIYGNWQEIYINEAEGQVEAHVPCGPRTYTLWEVPIDKGETTIYKCILNVGMIQDSKTDTVEWIRRTSDGFLISAFNSYDEQRPYLTSIVIQDSTWNLLAWSLSPQGATSLFANDSYGEPLYEDQCPTEEEEP